jgi:hypothetical protein
MVKQSKAPHGPGYCDATAAPTPGFRNGKVQTISDKIEEYDRRVCKQHNFPLYSANLKLS